MREAELVQELDREVAAFRENAGARRLQQGPAGPGHESRPLRPHGDNGDPFGGRAKPAQPDDPDVWPPPTPREKSPAQPRKRQGGRDLPSWARREARDARAKYAAAATGACPVPSHSPASRVVVLPPDARKRGELGARATLGAETGGGVLVGPAGRVLARVLAVAARARAGVGTRVPVAAVGMTGTGSRRRRSTAR